jgi:hypothetical protein
MVRLSQPGARPGERLTQISAEVNGGDQVEQVPVRVVGVLAPLTAVSTGNANAQ